VLARMPFSTIAWVLLLGSFTGGCRPFVLHAPDLAAHFGDAAEEKSADKSESPAKDSDGEETKPAQKDDADSNEAPPIELGQGEWILRVAPPGEKLEANALRWRNIPLEEALAQPPAEQPDFNRWLKHKSKSVAANAAIAAARLLVEDSPVPSPSDQPLSAENEAIESAGTNEQDQQLVISTLAKAVRTSELKLSQRRAAIEALGRLPGEKPRHELFALADQYADFAGPKRNVYNPDLHIELLAALAQQPDEPSIARFTAAIPCRATEVRLAVVQY